MENTRIAAIKKTAGVAEKVLNIFKTILIVGLVLCIVGAVMVFAGPKLGEFTVKGETVTVYNMIDANAVLPNNLQFLDNLPLSNTVKMCITCIIVAICVGLALILVTAIKKMFTEIKESDTPFRESILPRIKVTGIVLTLFVLSQSVGIAIVTALTFWCIYCVFEYGVELQNNEDETL